MNYAELSPVELVLACLRTGEEPAWIEFVRRFQPLIAGIVMRIARRWGQTSTEVVDDLVQETYLKLCADRDMLLHGFHPKHPDAIFGYIKVFTANLVHDHFKAVHSRKRGGGTKTEPVDDHTPGTLPLSPCDAKSIERAVLLNQIDACLREAESGVNAKRDRGIFWLYYRVGLPASAIAALPAVGLTTKGVESTILRLTRVVRRRLARTENSIETEGDPSKGIRPAESF